MQFFYLYLLSLLLLSKLDDLQQQIRTIWKLKEPLIGVITEKQASLQTLPSSLITRPASSSLFPSSGTLWRRQADVARVLHLFWVLVFCRRDASHDPLMDTKGDMEDCSPFLPHYLFLYFPSLKSQRNAHPPVSLVCCSFLHLLFEIQNKKWLPLPRDIALWLRCKLIWKADAHTSYFTRQNTKVITMTPAELWVANLVSGLW